MSSLSQTQMLLVMQLADGELEGAERVQAEQLVTDNPEAATLLAELLGLGQGVVHATAQRDIGNIDIAGSVVAKIEAAAASTSVTSIKGAGNVRSLDAARAKKSMGSWAAPALGAVALAAGLFLLVRGQPKEIDAGKLAAESPSLAKPVASMQLAAASTPSPDQMSPAQEPSGNGVDINVVESPSHAVSVFVLPESAAAASSVVVWIDDSAGEK